MLVGLGYWGRKVLKEYVTLLDLNKLDLIYVYDLKLGQFEFNDNRIEPISSISEAIMDVDFAHICTPNVSHFEIAKEFLENRIPTLVEKPVSEDSAKALDLLNLSEETSTPFRVGMVYRFSEVVEKARKLLTETVGYPKFIDASWMHNIEIPNIRRVMQDRDVVWDVFIHLLDIIHYLFDEWPVFDHAKGSREKTKLNNSFISTAHLKDAIISFRSSFTSHMKERKIKIVGEELDLDIDFLNNVISIGSDSKSQVLTFYDNPLNTELVHFISDKVTLESRNDGKVGYMETKLIESMLELSRRDG